MARSHVSYASAALGAPLRDDVVADIARQLEDAGVFRVTMVPDLPQRLVDLRWAALRAGRILGRPVKMAVSGAAVSSAGSPVTIRMTCASETRQGIPRQREHD